MARRIQKELEDLADFPGLSISSNEGVWRCTYTCPTFYRRANEQRRSPYEGFCIHFVIQFPSEYPFKPFRVDLCHNLTSKAIFHPLVAYEKSGVTTLPLGVPMRLEEWSPQLTVRSFFLERSVVPMWSDADAWVRADKPDCCGYEAARVTSVPQDLELFPPPRPPFAGDAPPHGPTWDERYRQQQSDLRQHLQHRVNTAPSYNMPSLTITTWTKKQFLIDGLMSNDTLMTLMARIQDHEGIPEDQQKLVGNGKELSKWSILADTSITEQGSNIYLVQRLRGCSYFFHGNGYNETAVHYLCEDVRRFELLARASVVNSLGALSNEFTFLSSYVVGSDPERLRGVLVPPSVNQTVVGDVELVTQLIRGMEGVQYFVGPVQYNFDAVRCLDHPTEGWNACLVAAERLLLENADLQSAMTVAQVALLRLYTVEAPHVYAVLNGTLRDATPMLLAGHPIARESTQVGVMGAHQRVLPFARMFYHALLALPPRFRRRQRLFRRESMTHPDFAATFIVGGQWGVCSFTSFSLDLSDAPIAPGAGGIGTVHVINNCPGFDLRLFAIFPENEILVCAGSTFITRSVDTLQLPGIAPGSMRTVESDFGGQVELRAHPF